MRVRRLFRLRLVHQHNRNVVLAGKLEVALIVGGNGHNRARAVAHQDVIGNPYREWVRP